MANVTTKLNRFSFGVIRGFLDLAPGVYSGDATAFLCQLLIAAACAAHAIETNIGDSRNIIIQLERRPARRYVSQILEV
jgi:hypothetical protein